MNTDIQTANRAMQAHAVAKLHALKPVLVGLLIAVPAALASATLMDSRTAWPNAPYVMLAILVLTLGNFLALVAIEPYRSRLGELSMPAMLVFIGMTFAYMVTESIDRFVDGYGFGWLTPVTIVALAVIYGGILREKFLMMQLALCLNGLALSVLWSLGDVDKVALPF